MSFIKSSNISVFPCVSRNSNYDLDSKLMSEKNITNILKSVTDRESYIISWEGTTLKCVIKGYYFEITDIQQSGNKYAHLKMNTTQNILNGTDEVSGDNSEFKGVDINTTPADADLTLCVGGNIPDSSRSKFNTKSLNVDLTTINCGELK